jgi:hypothetical protein
MEYGNNHFIIASRAYSLQLTILPGGEIIFLIKGEIIER